MKGPSKTANGLAQRIAAILADSGPRKPHWFRSFAASDAMFEQAIGRLFINGQVKFKGRGKGRVMVRA